MFNLGFTLICLSFVDVRCGYISGDVPSFEPTGLEKDLVHNAAHFNHILFLQRQLMSKFSVALKSSIGEFWFEGLQTYNLRLHTIWTTANCGCISKFRTDRVVCENQIRTTNNDLSNHCHILGAKLTTAFLYHFVAWQKGITFQKLDNRPVVLNVTVGQHLYINCTFTTLCLPVYGISHYTNRLSLEFDNPRYSTRYKQFSFQGCYATPITIFTSVNWTTISSSYDYAVDTTLFNWELTYQTLKTLITQNFMTRILNLTEGVFSFDMFHFPSISGPNKVTKQWHFKSLPFESVYIHFMDITGTKTIVKVYDGPGVKSPVIFYMENSHVLIGRKYLKTSNQFLIEMASDLSGKNSSKLLKAYFSTTMAKFDPTVCLWRKLKSNLTGDTAHFEIGVRTVRRDRNIQCFFPVRYFAEHTKAISVTLRIEHVHYKGPNTLLVNKRSHFLSLRGEDSICDYGGFSIVENADITHYVTQDNPVGKFYICDDTNSIFETSWHSNESIHRNLVFSFNSYKAYSEGTFKAIVIIQYFKRSWLNQLDFFGTKDDPPRYHLSTHTQTFVPHLIRHHIYPNAKNIWLGKTSRYDFFGPTEVRLVMTDCLTQIQCIENQRRNCSSFIEVDVNNGRTKKLQLRVHGETHFIEWANEIHIVDKTCPTDVMSFVVLEFKKFDLTQSNVSITNKGHAYIVLLNTYLLDPFVIFFYGTTIEYFQYMWSYFYITKRFVGGAYPFTVSISPMDEIARCVVRGIEVTENSGVYIYRYVTLELTIDIQPQMINFFFQVSDQLISNYTNHSMHGLIYMGSMTKTNGLCGAYSYLGLLFLTFNTLHRS